MSPRTGDELHWDGNRRRGILSLPPGMAWRREKSHVDDPVRRCDS
jgi:hypothetical protein